MAGKQTLQAVKKSGAESSTRLLASLLPNGRDDDVSRLRTVSRPHRCRRSRQQGESTTAATCQASATDGFPTPDSTITRTSRINIGVLHVPPCSNTSTSQKKYIHMWPSTFWCSSLAKRFIAQENIVQVRPRLCPAPELRSPYTSVLNI
jgi:hypothetical protein